MTDQQPETNQEHKERKEVVTVQQGYSKTGGFGRYQCFILLVTILANNGPGFIVYGAAYYELEAPYLCTYNVP